MGVRTVESIVKVAAGIGEGPIWDHRGRCLWWIDILGKKLFRFDSATKEHKEWALAQMPGAVVVRESGGLMLSVENGFACFNPSNGELKMFAEVETDNDDNRFNDGKCDPAGRFWAGSMHRREESASGSLYSLGIDGQVTRRFGGVSVSNGIAWSKDATTMFYIDSAEPHVFAFDYDNVSGKISNRRRVFDVPPGWGAPDGMAIDAEDKLWVGFWGGWCVANICPLEGKMLSRIELPVANVTACAFGGKSLDQLFITTARAGLDEQALAEQPLAGNLFLTCPGARGVESAMYKG